MKYSQLEREKQWEKRNEEEWKGNSTMKEKEGRNRVNNT